jgi:hypothetical protein
MEDGRLRWRLTIFRRRIHAATEDMAAGDRIAADAM